MNGSMVKKPHLIKNGIRIPCNTENFVLIVNPSLSSSSSGSSSTLRTSVKQESHSSSSSSTSSSSPTESEIQTREREDRTEIDNSPVQVSTTVDDRSGIKSQNQSRRNPKGNRATRCSPTQVVQVLRSRSGCKNSGKNWWMMKFKYREILTPTHRMDYLSSLREVRICVSTVF